MLGLVAWIAALVLVAWNSELARTLTAALALGALAFAAYLVILQLFVIDAICIWCMVNDVVLVPLLAVLRRVAGSRPDSSQPLARLARGRRAGLAGGSPRPGRAGYVIGTWRRMSAWMRSRISVRLSPVAVMPWLRRPITAWAGSGSRSISSATDSASSCVPHG